MIIVREDGAIGINFDGPKEAEMEIATLTARLIKFTVQKYLSKIEANQSSNYDALVEDITNLLHQTSFEDNF